MRLKLSNDFLGVFVLLWGKVGVVQDPVVGLTKLVLVPQQVDGVFHQLEHFVAAFDAPGVLLNTGIRKIHAGKVNRFQKILNAAAKLNLELAAYLLDG